MRVTNNITKELIDKWFYYKDGGLYYKKRPSRNCVVGERCGSISSYGYRVVQIEGVKYKEHRLILVLFNGEIPPYTEIDHIDNDPLNNMIENLRLANRSENMCNRVWNKRNKSGIKGVFLNKNNKWTSVVRKDKKQFFIGIFGTKELAGKAYNKYAKKLHGEFFK
jgi:hypothetical protein